jgi:hypothetical protein
LLESAAIKISGVLTDLHGVTGRDIMDPGQPGLRDGFARRHLLGEALRLAGHAPLQRRPVQRLIRRVPPARGQV